VVGRVPGSYSLYVGGDFEGTRLNELLAERLDIAGLADVLDPLFALFAASRRHGEGFGNFCHRIGVAALQQVVQGVRRKAA
jgi:sulfite reductase (ferredoxin)